MKEEEKIDINETFLGGKRVEPDKDGKISGPNFTIDTNGGTKRKPIVANGSVLNESFNKIQIGSNFWSGSSAEVPIPLGLG